MFRSVLVEIRDAGTFIPALVTWVPKVGSGDDHYLLRRAGWQAGTPIIWLTRLVDGVGQSDPYKWGENPRTMIVAHLALYGRTVGDMERALPVHRIDEGQVIDVEWLLGIRDEPKVSEAGEVPG